MRRLVGISVSICVVVLAVCAASVAAASGPALPTADPFYAHSGSLTGVAPGTVLRSRVATFNEAGISIPISTTQVLYRTTGELGQPTVTVATIVAPLLALGQTKLVSYQMAYDGMAPECDPSYAIQGGSPTESTNTEEQQLVLGLAALGDTVVTSDYEGESLDFGAGQEAGYGTLDAIRAAESQLKLSTSTPVALIGYSGGSIATDFAAEFAPSYAPALNIVGAAFGGIPVDYVHNLDYINGSPSWGGAIPAVLIGLARAFHISLTQYLSPYGLHVVDSVHDACLASSLGEYPDQKMFKPQYANVFGIPVLVHAFNHLVMGDSGTPREPLFMGVGNADGTGDDVMVAADDEALAHTYCARGLSVQFSEYKGDDHGTAALAFLPAALLFIEGRLTGTPAKSDCASIAAGNSLAPLPLPRTSWKLAVTPSHASAGSRTTFTFTLTQTAGVVRSAGSGATVRFAGHRVRTNQAGRARITFKPAAHPLAAYRASASVSGHRVAVVTVHVSR